jgi:hypothetical protein
MAHQARTLSQAFLTKLMRLAIDGLSPLYDSQRRLFAYQIRDGQRVPMSMEFTLTYTAITALGLLKAQHNNLEIFDIDVDGMLLALLEHAKDRGWSGDIGLYLWLDAHHEGAHRQALIRLIRQLIEADSLGRITTMELSWLLIGLCYTHQKFPQEETTHLCRVVFEAIAKRVYTSALFPHTMMSGIRSQIGNFADQIYTVYALATFHASFDNRQALDGSRQCARRLIALQGAQGQWWWHYHAKRGVVVARYPVFAVHQHAMAPMGLLKLAAVAKNEDFSAAIERSLSWLLPTHNELQYAMIDWQQNVIWRDIERARPADYARYLSMGLAEVGITKPIDALERIAFFKLNREMRPYELGWLLYAFAEQHLPP